VCGSGGGRGTYLLLHAGDARPTAIDFSSPASLCSAAEPFEAIAPARVITFVDFLQARRRSSRHDRGNPELLCPDKTG
jgi:hypothetical protein